MCFRENDYNIVNFIKKTAAFMNERELRLPPGLVSTLVDSTGDERKLAMRGVRRIQYSLTQI